MPIQVDAYTAEGIASGTVDRPGVLRDALETSTTLVLSRASWQAMGSPRQPIQGDLSLVVDDLLIVIGNDDPFIALHASWHAIRLEVGPYLLAGELPTLPGFDPGRALTRPGGEFVMLRDIRLGFLSMPDLTIDVPHALINRYGVDRVDADIMLGFFFPGAAMDGSSAAPVADTGATAPTTA